MAEDVVMPRLGNSVESSVIVSWKKQIGDAVAVGDVLCDVETDKTTAEVESPVAGVLLEQRFAAGADVPVLTVIARVGQVGALSAATPAAPAGVSPRARGLAAAHGIDATHLSGSGPNGRVIERDVRAALDAQPAAQAAPVDPVRMTPVARRMVDSGAFLPPAQGSGPGGIVTKQDLSQAQPHAIANAHDADSETVPLKGVRKIVAERMLHSLQSTAQLTLNASADARALLAYRERLKASTLELGLSGISINDLALFAVARALLAHPDLNATFDGAAITRHRRAHLAFAVDTPRGLLVPVIRDAGALSLKALSLEAKRLIRACTDGSIALDALSGGTFTVSNLGALGIETFTPVLNPPQVAILGIGGIALKPVHEGAAVVFHPHLALSLTINHQVVDGAPAARFLQTLARALADIDLLTAQ
jgi:pyruvate dehydrogenase E2 component (dihydrolipoamide acetyltransferase)